MQYTMDSQCPLENCCVGRDCPRACRRVESSSQVFSRLRSSLGRGMHII